MRATTLTGVAICFAATLLYIALAIEFAVGPPATHVVSWWWKNGDRQVSVLLFSLGFVAFPVLLSLWGRNWIRIIKARAVSYVWLGPTLQRKRNYFFALDDPRRRRVVLGSGLPDLGRGSGTRVNLLFAIKSLFSLDPNPEHAIETASLRPRAQALLLLTQYLALGFGLVAAGDLASQYIAARGPALTASLLPISVLAALLPPVCLHAFGMINGYIAFRKKTMTPQESDHAGVPRLNLKPGDAISVRIMERSQEGASSENNFATNLYRVEWTTGEGLTLSAILALRAKSQDRRTIEELDRMTEAQDEIQCLIAEDHRLRPLILSDISGIEWL